jgi:hypothetical protein
MEPLFWNNGRFNFSCTLCTKELEHLGVLLQWVRYSRTTAVLELAHPSSCQHPYSLKMYSIVHGSPTEAHVNAFDNNIHESSWWLDHNTKCPPS